MSETAALSAPWQRTPAYVRAFVAERLVVPLHNDDGRYRVLTAAEGEVVLQAVFDLLAEDEFVGGVQELPHA